MKVIKIGAVWCSGCLVMRPRWQSIETSHPWLKTEYYDFDQDQTKLKNYKLNTSQLPTFIFLDKNNHELTRVSGEIKTEKLIELITTYKDK